jgi:DNA-binding FadR family transcriptional regulator
MTVRSKSGPAQPPSSEAPTKRNGKAPQVAEAIRSDIAAGRLKPGDALLPEPQLMAHYKVSTPTMRAALRILESEGLLKIHRGAQGGPRVQELDVNVLARRAKLYLQVEGAGLADLLEALSLLEPGAVALAAERRTSTQLAELWRCVERAADCATMSDFSEVAADFVLLLLEASGNKSLKLFGLVIDSLVRQEFHRELEASSAPEVRQWHAERFAEVVQLIELGQGEAAAALWRAHILMSDPTVTRPTTGRKLGWLPNNKPFRSTS